MRCQTRNLAVLAHVGHSLCYIKVTPTVNQCLCLLMVTETKICYHCAISHFVTYNGSI